MAKRMTEVKPDAELLEMEKRSAALRLQMMELEYEDLQMRVENERNRRASIARNHKAQQDTLDKFNEDVIAQQSYCRHKKGGKDLAGILKGTDSNYSVIHHTYPWGEQVAMCTRCGKDWRKPKPALMAENPALYQLALKEWREAMEFPTDNTPSGTQIFIVTPGRAA